jgi:hypothetical protein
LTYIRITIKTGISREKGLENGMRLFAICDCRFAIQKKRKPQRLSLRPVGAYAPVGAHREKNLVKKNAG